MFEIEGQAYDWGYVHMGRYTLTHHVLNRKCSPFLQKDMPGLYMNVRRSNMPNEVAYRMCHPLAQAQWRPSPEFPTETVISYYKQILSHIGYFAICEAKSCIRS